MARSIRRLVVGLVMVLAVAGMGGHAAGVHAGGGAGSPPPLVVSTPVPTPAQ
jgi:hypothetical protein